MRQFPLLSFLALGFDLSLGLPGQGWGPRKFKSLVTFGDSYTDDSRLNYLGSHNGAAPPVGWEQPVNNNSASGGYTWGYFVAEAAKVNRYNYAVSGAVCSNKITPRTFSTINAPFPSVLEYEVPAYVADSKYKTSSGKKFLDIPPEETVYAIWIGTNDLGNYAFLTDSQVAGKTIPDYANCIYDALEKVYKNGGRYFIIMNNAPLQLAPMYATIENGGTGKSQYWPDKPSNDTLYSYRMWEQVSTVNQVFEYKTPFEMVLSDMYYDPRKYFDGQANVTGYINHCTLAGQNCVRLADEGSFMWYDTLHPSEKTDKFIAREFLQVVKGGRMSSPEHCHALKPPPRPIAIRPEYIASTETTITVTNRAEPWHSLDYSVEHEGTSILTVCGQPWSLGQRKVFHDRTGLPLFELQNQWYNSSAMSLTLPGDTEREILSAKLRVAVHSPSAVVTFANALRHTGRSPGAKETPDTSDEIDTPHFVKIELHRLDLDNIVQVVVLEDCRVACIHRVTDRGALVEGQWPPFRFRPKWRVTIACGMDISLVAVLVIIAGRRTGALVNNSHN
ncbi:hypothetical protein BDV59DRAFT_207094 [Aspergillus ambiguus]|uniref:SGNH/GDSL hydrolase family protein n=1 Tax=Aspergillus ambiguus TaxID=176160 RepID=UPI003CCD2A2C